MCIAVARLRSSKTVGLINSATICFDMRCITNKVFYTKINGVVYCNYWHVCCLSEENKEKQRVCLACERKKLTKVHFELFTFQ